MAHLVAGVDLGAAAIKIVVVEVGFRHTRVHSAFEQAVPLGDASLIERQKEAVTAGLARLPPELTVHVAMPGDHLAVRLLELPFADARKIDQVVGYELEGQIVYPLDEVIYDHAILNLAGDHTSVLAVAARTSDVSAYLDALKTAGVEPRSLFAAPVIYRALPGLAAAPERAEPLVVTDDHTQVAAAPEPAKAFARLIIDFGHQRTNLCVLSGADTIFARSFPRGGEDLTLALAKAFQVPLEEAERGKREHGVMASARVAPHTQLEERVAEVLDDALAPWLRELRQTLGSFRAHSPLAVTSFTVVGGGAALRGLVEVLEDEIGAPHAAVLSDVGDPVNDDGALASSPLFALAAAVAWAGARGSKEIDLRRGPFVFRANYSILRQKAWHLVGLAAAVLVTVGIDGTMALGRLADERKQLEAEIQTATRDLFGVPRMDAREVTAELKRSFKDDMVTLPKMTAFELLDEISRQVPSAEKVKLDVQELDIKPKKVFIKGTIDSSTAVDDVVARLKQIDCFEDITKGAITEVSGGAKQFTLTIGSKCP